MSSNGTSENRVPISPTSFYCLFGTDSEDEEKKELLGFEVMLSNEVGESSLPNHEQQLEKIEKMLEHSGPIILSFGNKSVKLGKGRLRHDLYLVRSVVPSQTRCKDNTFNFQNYEDLDPNLPIWAFWALNTV